MFSLRLLSLLAVAYQAVQVSADLPHLTDMKTYNDWSHGGRPNQTYHTSKIKSPRFLINKWNKTRTAGSGTHLFMAPAMSGQGATPFIMDASDLSLVYADPEWKGSIDTRMQIHNGEKFLTFWSGWDQKGHGTGGNIMLDSNYRKFRNLTTTGFDTGADSHDFKMTDDGGAIMNNYHTIKKDLREIGGPKYGQLLDCAFQEVDVQTGDVRFTWKATDHFNLTEAMGDKYWKDLYGFDWFHMNAISKTKAGNYLISVRHLRTVALINGTDGSRIWQIGGKHNSFKDLSGGKATDFAFQHDARFTDDTETEITLFDNHAMHITSPTQGCKKDCSRGLRIRIDYEKMTVKVVSEFYHPASVQAWAQGGYHLLPNGHSVLGWGVVPAFTEFDANGEIVMDVQVRPWNTTGKGGGPLYRVYKFDWVGQPLWQPSAAYVNGTAYISWNGATEVKRWVLYGGDTPLTLTNQTTVDKRGFETSIEPPSQKAFVRIDALNARGELIGSSNVVDTATGDTVGSLIRKD